MPEFDLGPTLSDKPTDNTGTRKLAYWAVGLIGLAGLAFFAVNRYRDRAELSNIRILVLEDAGALETVLKADSEKRMTYKDLFDACEASLKTSTSIITKLRQTELRTGSIKDPTISLLSAEQSLVRAKVALYKADLGLSNDIDTLAELKRRQHAYETMQTMGSIDYRLDAARNALSTIQDEFRIFPSIHKDGEDLTNTALQFAADFKTASEIELKFVKSLPEIRSRVVISTAGAKGLELAIEKSRQGIQIQKDY